MSFYKVYFQGEVYVFLSRKPAFEFMDVLHREGRTGFTFKRTKQF